MNPKNILLLEFDPKQSKLTQGKELRDGLSVVLQMNSTLWVANDETVSLERLTLTDPEKLGNYTVATNHKQFPLSDYLSLPAPSRQDSSEVQEIDIEGLAYADHYLWIVGSHSLKRKKPTSKNENKAHKQLAQSSKDGNRYLLARIPVEEIDSTYQLAKQISEKHKRYTAAKLHGDALGNDLTVELGNDEHLSSFLSIPGKDNGFDIEGLVVLNKRLFLGLRGPVLRGWAVILEIEPEEDKSQPEVLRLKAIGPHGRKYRKHFLQLGGLGIRDMCVQGQDLLILAGPTMELDGPVTLFRWTKGAKSSKDENLVPSEALEKVLDLPFGVGVDHAEGMSLFSSNGGETDSLLVVYDAASANRQILQRYLVADVFSLPKADKSKS